MKRIFLTIVSLTLLLSSCSKDQKLTSEQLKAIVLKDANINEKDIISSKIEKDNNNQVVVEISTQQIDYKYKVDGNTGKIIENISNQPTSVPTQAPAPSNAQQQGITLEQAKDIAFKDANVNGADVTIIQAYLNNENEYDIEFVINNQEYDYEIDATTGAIKEKDLDIENYVIPSASQPSNQNASGITQEQALDVVLADLGLKKDQVYVAELKFDRSDNEYDIKLYYNNVEYEYEINASNGSIHSKDID
ncbi:MAG: PepSY domain-containing protein [Erysipelotrichaceae bacterium]|nr:PepSY domain-containing protein [Erysipelotrichaceae bacterium]MDO5084851.1 PepSY domain-containing protein [Erysipelotrichaceae bacterium]